MRLMSNLLFYCLGVIAVYLLVVVEKSDRKTTSSEKDNESIHAEIVYNGDNPKPPQTTPSTNNNQSTNEGGLLTPVPSSPMHQDDGTNTYKG